MRYDLSSHFEEPEFRQILTKYEGMAENHTPLYFDQEELTDLADYYIYIGEEDKADKVIEYSLQLYPNNTDALIYKVRKLYFKGEKEMAFRLMEQIEEPTEREVMFLKAEIFIEENKLKEAELIFQELAESEGETIHILRDITLCYMDTNNKEYTHLWMSKIEEKGYNQENSQIYRDLWCDYCMLFGNPSDAINAYLISVDEHPYSINHWNGLTRCYLAQNNIPKAHEAVDFSLAIDESNPDARELKAFCYIHQDEYVEAISIYESLLQADPKNKFHIFSILAQCHISLGQFSEAIKYYQNWLNKHSKISNYEKAEIYSHIAMCYCNMELPKEGMKYIDASLQLDPFNCGSIIQKGTLHYQLNEYQEAERLFQKVQEDCPMDERQEMLYAIINSYLFLKQYDKAINLCKTTIEKYPDHRRKGIALIAFSYFEMKEYKNGLPFLIEAISLYKEDLQNNTKNAELIKSMIMEIKDNTNLDINLGNI